MCSGERGARRGRRIILEVFMGGVEALAHRCSLGRRDRRSMRTSVQSYPRGDEGVLAACPGPQEVVGGA